MYGFHIISHMAKSGSKLHGKYFFFQTIFNNFLNPHYQTYIFFLESTTQLLVDPIYTRWVDSADNLTEVRKETNHIGQWNAELAWYSLSATQ